MIIWPMEAWKTEVREVFTVVIAEKEHIKSIQEYNIFLKPFMEDKKVAFCAWNTEGETLADAVPALVDAVARQSLWRAVVVCDERGLNQKNPFHLVTYQAPEAKPEESREEYFSRVRESKFKAFESAAALPLTRLMTYLCESPLVNEGRNHADADPEFAEYRAEALYKQELRLKMKGQEKMVISLPSEVYCIAKRTSDVQEYDINSSWTPHIDHQYSRFYDWNLYFDKMRYLVFDILPKDNQNYRFDYIRFLYALLLFASNDVPDGCLRPNRVYSLNCVNDEGELRRLIVSYDEKLCNTAEAIENEIEELKQKQKNHLTDKEAASLFCTGVTVPVTLDQSFDVDELFAEEGELGLSTDCPRDEYNAWEVTYLRSEKTLYKLVKQPRRSLKKAVSSLKGLSEADYDRVKLLNSFQMEDVREYVEDAEKKMVEIPTTDLYDMEQYQKKMAEADKEVRSKIGVRMTRRTTVFLGASVLAVYFLSFLPLIINNFSSVEARMFAFLFTGGAVILIFLVGLVCLFCLRWALKMRIKFFNETMWDIKKEIDHSLLQFSRYLSHACNMMRGNSVINYFNEHEDKDVLQIRIRRKHLGDIARCREELRDIFGTYMTDPSLADPTLTEAYPYNFSRAMDFDYSLPYTEGEERQIEYMEAGCQITVPVDFVKRITVRLEELYD